MENDSSAIYFNYIQFSRNPFFIDPRLDKRNKKKNHKEKIFEIYKCWLEHPFEYEPDLEDFDLNKLKIEFKNSIPTRIVEQGDEL